MTALADMLKEWDHRGGWSPSMAEFELLRSAYDALRETGAPAGAAIQPTDEGAFPVTVLDLEG